MAIAVNLLKLGLAEDIVAQNTGLTAEQVEQAKQNLENGDGRS